MFRVITLLLIVLLPYAANAGDTTRYNFFDREGRMTGYAKDYGGRDIRLYSPDGRSEGYIRRTGRGDYLHFDRDGRWLETIDDE